MANTVIAVNELTEYNTFSAAETYANLTAAVDSTSLTAEVALKARDEKCLLLITNAHVSAAKKVTIKAGNGIQGVTDIEKEIAAGKYVIISLESGAFKNVTGDNKGKVIIVGASADIEVAAFRLP